MSETLPPTLGTTPHGAIARAERRPPRWWRRHLRVRNLVALSVVILGMVTIGMGVEVIDQRVDTAIATQAQLDRLDALLHEISATESQAMELGIVDDEVTTRIRSLVGDFDIAREALTRAGGPESRGTPLAQLGTYRRAILLQTGLIEQGRFAAAQKVDAVQVDPLVPIITAELRSAKEVARSAESRSGNLIQWGLLAFALLFFVMTTAIAWRLSRARATAGAAAHESSALHESEARFRSLVQHSTDAIMVVDRDGVIRYEGASVANVLGHEPGALAGRPLSDLVHPEDAEALTTQIFEKRGPDTHGGVECRWLASNDRWLLCETIATNLADDPHVRGWVLNTRNVSERKALETELTFQATHDALTGLANRARFGHMVDEAVRNANNPSNLAILFVDIDDFKQVNDSAGHAVGDALLVQVADRLRRCVREVDEVARLGGDEFGILLAQVAGEDEAIAVAVRIFETLAAPVLSGPKRLLISASVGVAVGLSPGEDGTYLIRKADDAMYVAKQRGKRGYALYRPEFHADLIEGLAAIKDLKRAVAQDEIVAVFQPIVEVATGRIARVEALARWNHPSRGFLGPAHFIPIAEETGLIVDVGRGILRNACRQVSRWRASMPGYEDLGVNVNVAPRQLDDMHFVDDVRAALAESGLPAGALTLELTESSLLLQEPERVIAILEMLRTVGVDLAIDDFGTGFSSLSYLQRLPVTHLKIDRSFASSLSRQQGDGSDPPLFGAIVNLANAVGLEVTAEGIEHAEQVDRLQSLDCALMQGFFISKPLGENACRSFLEEWAAAGSLDIAARLHPRTDGRSTPPARAAATS